LTAIEPGADDYCRVAEAGDAGAIISKAISVWTGCLMPVATAKQEAPRGQVWTLRWRRFWQRSPAWMTAVFTVLTKTAVHYSPEARVAADHLLLVTELNSAWLETEHKLPVTPCPARRGDL
jgi:hypothetical protein